MGWCFMFVFFHSPSLPDPLPVCGYKNMLPAPPPPPLSWHFRATREWCPFCVEGWVPGEVFPFLSLSLFMSFHFSSIRSVCVFVGVQVHARPVCCGSLSVTSSLGWLHQRGQNRKRPVIVLERSFVKCLSHCRGGVSASVCWHSFIYPCGMSICHRG